MSNTRLIINIIIARPSINDGYNPNDVYLATTPNKAGIIDAPTYALAI